MIRIKLIFLLIMACVLFQAECNQASEETADKRPKTQTLENNNEQSRELEKKDLELILGELKNKNPFSAKRYRPTTEAKQELELQGIMRDGQKPFAVIDGTVVKEGDWIDGKKVLRIDDESVILDNQGREEVLKIKLKWR